MSKKSGSETDFVVVPSTADVKGSGGNQSAESSATALGRAARLLQSLSASLSGSVTNGLTGDGILPFNNAKPATSGDDKSDAKQTPLKVYPASLGSLLKSAGMRIGGKKLGAYRTRVVERYTANGSTNTLFSVAKKLNPNDSTVTEGTAFQTLFDEGRCVAIDLHVRASGSTAITTATWGFAYDPCNNGLYTSVQGVLIASQHRGPIAYNPAASNGGPVVQNASGFVHAHVKVPKVSPTAGMADPSESIGSNWFAMSDTVANSGYLKIIVDAVTSTAVTFDAFIVYHMEYRSRT